MKTYTFFESKRHHNVEFDNTQLCKSKLFTNNEWSTPNVIREKSKNILTVKASSLEEAYGEYIDFISEIKRLAKEEHESLKRIRQAKIKSLIESEVIPTTIENLSLVLEYLNNQNWGTWKLPKLSIGYTAHQYDCDGKTVTTISLDEPIPHCGRMVRFFKSGHKTGHLNKFETI